MAWTRELENQFITLRKRREKEFEDAISVIQKEFELILGIQITKGQVMAMIQKSDRIVSLLKPFTRGGVK